MQKLQELAGAAPLKLAAHEKVSRAARPPQFLEGLQQEQTLEASDGQELDEGLQELEATLQDPMQRVMLLQMKQLQVLSKQARTRPTTPSTKLWPAGVLQTQQVRAVVSKDACCVLLPQGEGIVSLSPFAVGGLAGFAAC